MKFLKSKGNLSSMREKIFALQLFCSFHDWVISQRISFHLVSREKLWFWKEKVKQDDFSSASDLKIHSNGHFIERFYKYIRQLLGSTGHTGKISKRVKSVHWDLSWLNSKIPAIAGDFQLERSFGWSDLWLTETAQVQGQEKFWGWVSCISPKIATDPESSALWQGSVAWGRLEEQLEEKLMLNCSLGKCKPLSDWWRKWELGSLSYSPKAKINVSSRARQRKILRKPAQDTTRPKCSQFSCSSPTELPFQLSVGELTEEGCKLWHVIQQSLGSILLSAFTSRGVSQKQQRNKSCKGQRRGASN